MPQSRPENPRPEPADQSPSKRSRQEIAGFVDDAIKHVENLRKVAPTLRPLSRPVTISDLDDAAFLSPAAARGGVRRRHGKSDTGDLFAVDEELATALYVVASTKKTSRRLATALWTHGDDDLENKVIEMAFAVEDLDHEGLQKTPEAAFQTMMKTRRAEVKVSTLTPARLRELRSAKSAEIQTWLRYHVVEAASREGLSP